MLRYQMDVAQHEAAHVVVGVALGLKLKHATTHAVGDWLGYAWFHERGHRGAHAIMYAAGLAWERSIGGVWLGTPDDRLAREHLPGRGGLHACVRAADAMLRGLKVEHARVARALEVRRYLSGRDVEALARGEQLSVDE
jgi:hypothetical protein